MTPAKKEPDLTTYSGRLAARLRELRTKAKLTQVDVANALGVSQNAVSTWEIGSCTPPMNTIPELAQTLKLKKIREIFPAE